MMSGKKLEAWYGGVLLRLVLGGVWPFMRQLGNHIGTMFQPNNEFMLQIF
jgi:hypothetical protein